MARKNKDIENLIAQKDEFDKESQELLSNIVFERSEISEIDAMKRTQGWKIMDKKIREELQQTIFDLTKDNVKVQTLLALLEVSATKKRTKVLENEIEKIVEKILM